MNDKKTKIHLDTDLGGDINDFCALAFLLRSPNVEIVGTTVVGDNNGKRTGYTKYALNSNPTLIPLTVTIETFLRRSYLDKLKNAGSLCKLIAKQAESFAEDEKMETRLGRPCEKLPDDFINFQHDPLTCAIALGWSDGIEIKNAPLRIEEKEGWLYENVDSSSKKFKVVTKIDGTRFSEFWLNRVSG